MVAISRVIERKLVWLRAGLTGVESDGPSPQSLTLLRDSGLLGTIVPAEYGGLGGDALSSNQVVTGVARVDPSLAIIAFQHFAVSARIADWGTPEQRAQWLPRLAAGTMLAASAWSETGAGADKKSLSTTAVRDATADDWLVTGVKSFATGAGVADLYLILAQTQENAESTSIYGRAGQTFFLIEAGAEGLSTDTGFALDGMRGSATGSVILDRCRVTARGVLGEVGDAPRIISTVRESGATLGAVSAGIAQAAYELAAEHAAKRGAMQQQAVRHRLVDLRAQVEAVEAAVERAGARTGADPGLSTLYSKLFASAAAEEICLQAQRLLGSAGYLRSNPLNRLARDARAVALMGPTNDLCRELVSAGWGQA
jgi:alkylation response protein AidB-like acyl-CoA dehydrogenase